MSILSPMMEYFARAAQKAVDTPPPYRGKVSMLHYGDYVLITSEICGEIERRWFHEQNPIYYYHMTREARLPLVRAMYVSGCSPAEIAELIGFSATTVSADIHASERVLETQYMPRIKPRDVTPKDVILKSTSNQKPQSFTPQDPYSY